VNNPSLIPPPAARNYLVTTPADRDTVRIRADKLSFGGFHFKDVDLTVNIEKPGLLGLDDGLSAISTWYYIHLLTDAKGTRLSAVLSTNATAPSSQAGYPITWRGGCIYNDAGGDFFRIYHNGDVWQFNEISLPPLRFVNGIPGVGPAWVLTPLSLQPPALYGGIVHLHGSYFCTCVGDDWWDVRPNGSNTTGSKQITRFRSIAVGVWDSGHVQLPTDALGQLQHISTHVAGGSTLYLDLTSYEDPLFK